MSCPLIATVGHPDIELSTYERSAGTYVVIGCIGFARHVAKPTSVTCLSDLQWSEKPNLTCSYGLDEQERLYLGIGIFCALLFLIIMVGVMCFFCLCDDDKRYKYFRYFYRDRGYPYEHSGYKTGEFNYYSNRSYQNDPPPYQREAIRQTYRDVGYVAPPIEKWRRDSIDGGASRIRITRRYSDGDRYGNYRELPMLTERYRRHSFDRQNRIFVRRYSDPSIYGDDRRIRRSYVYDEEPFYTETVRRAPSVEVIEVERPRPRIVTKYIEPAPLIKYVEPRYDVIPVRHTLERSYRPPPVERVVHSEYPSERVVSTIPTRASYRQSIITGKFQPMVLEDETIYLKYGASKRDTSVFGDSFRSYPRAKIVELDNESTYKSVVSQPSTQLFRSGHYEPKVISSSTNYFSGRQDYNSLRRTDREQDLDHVLYHGNGKQTEIYEEDSDFRKSRIL